jgi:hypothetical protein
VIRQNPGRHENEGLLKTRFYRVDFAAPRSADAAL